MKSGSIGVYVNADLAEGPEVRLADAESVGACPPLSLHTTCVLHAHPVRSYFACELRSVLAFKLDFFSKTSDIVLVV